MSSSEFEIGGLSIGRNENIHSLSAPQKSNAISAKLTSILSTSFTDADIREALQILDEKHLQNTPDTRRNLRADAQREVIERNGDIVKDFGQVAEVRPPKLAGRPEFT